MCIRDRQISKVFPYVEYGDRSFIQANTSQKPLGNHWMALSALSPHHSVKEYTCFLMSLQPIATDDIVKKMQEQEGDFTKRLYHVLKKQLLPLDYIRYTDGAQISFEGIIEDIEILPVMIEMNHVSK